MVSSKEVMARIKDHYRFSSQELIGLMIATIATGFIFSFRDWDTLNLSIGVYHLIAAIFVCALSFFVRISFQKLYGLTQGYRADFQVWWTGIIIALVIAFVSLGYAPLVIIGGVTSAFMVKHRLGEMRYGASHEEMAVISLMGVYGNLVLASLFSICLLFSPSNYFFGMGLSLNLIMAFTSMIPLPQLDGLNVFFGKRSLYFVGLGSAAVFSVLLFTRTKLGIGITIFALVGVAIYNMLTGSEK